MLALSTAALWGGNAVAVKYSVDTLPPIAVAALRFSLAAACLMIWCRISGPSLALRREEVGMTLVAGTLLFVQITLFNLGVHWSNASHATLLISTFVFWVAVLEHAVTKSDRITARKLVGLLLAAASVLIAVGSAGQTSVDAEAANGDPATLRGDLVLAASSFVLAIKVIYTKHAVRRIEPTRLIFWHHLVGVVLFALYSGIVEDLLAHSYRDFTLPVVLGLLYQGVLVGGVCFAIQATLLRRHSATQISAFAFATPLFGVLAAIVLRGDALSLELFVSGACAAAGIYLVTSRR